MRYVLLLLLPLTGCFSNVPVQKGGNIECFYGDVRIFSGKLTLAGEGVDAVKWGGSWSLCNHTGVRCLIDVETSSIADAGELD